ncbi:MAG: CRISPR-associated helicase Cas3' [Desulfovibrio sp.]|nr:CRISPR-associated helicase Cas3' [Desulfovibrio sp.]
MSKPFKIHCKSVHRPYIAHVRADDTREPQALSDHLLSVAELCKHFAQKIGLPLPGYLLGLLHDYGKYSTKFQNYLYSIAKLLDQYCDEYIDPKYYKGKIDHSTAGAQIVWQYFSRYGHTCILYAQMLSIVLCSHHSGLIDCLSPLGDQTFAARMGKADEKTHRTECDARVEEAIRGELHALLGKPLLQEMQKSYDNIRKREELLLEQAAEKKVPYDKSNILAFKLGLLTRFLLSCLLDADRINSTEFDDSTYTFLRRQRTIPDWSVLLARLENRLAKITDEGRVHDLRREVSNHCAARGKSPKGLFTLTVPTGGGKTLASLRFALTHAQEHGLNRIIYVLPYTSIIDQNADVTRDILEQGETPGSVVLEQHSNIQPEKENWLTRMLAPNWDSPVVFTTMVQFLETLFGSGTRGARRLHTLANAVIIFDEIQTLPVRCMHMFCNAVNFLLETCGSSAVLCTATQPLLGNLPAPHKGQLDLKAGSELMPDVALMFSGLRRVRFNNHCREIMDEAAIAKLALTEVAQSGSCLIVTNTKGWAERLYTTCKLQYKGHIFYLSTSLCPAHRLKILKKLDSLLTKGEPVLCVSTQLIECGVDLSFGSVIRFAAGLDSILQAAGRCNRHGARPYGTVHIVMVSPDKEHLEFLPDIAKGREVFLRMMNEHNSQLQQPDADLTRPEIIKKYFVYYFYLQSDNMEYPAPKANPGPHLLRMLGNNNTNPGYIQETRMLQQSFTTAASLFKPIDVATQGIIVPYGRGKEIIAELCSHLEIREKKILLHEAQRYTVTVYTGFLKRLKDRRALYSPPQTDILCLYEGFYSSVFGICTESVGNMQTIF